MWEAIVIVVNHTSNFFKGPFTKFLKLGICVAIFSLLVLSQARAVDLMQDFDSLGGNDVLLDRAKALSPEASISVVQDRVVDRRMREEITLEYGNALGGDAYVRAQNLGLNYHVHITPRWSVSAKYNYTLNDLSPEGQALINDKGTDGRGIVPDLDYQKQSYMALINWYPIFGKMNLYDLGVVQFDVYALGGYGQVELKSGRTETWTAGGGVGLWFSQYISSRLELRYQSFEAKSAFGPRDMDLTVASFQMGFLHSLF